MAPNQFHRQKGSGCPVRVFTATLVIGTICWCVVLFNYHMPATINTQYIPEINTMETTVQTKQSPIESSTIKSKDNDNSHHVSVETTSVNTPVNLNKYDASRWRSRDDLVHVVFSTDCSPFQDWQSQALFYSARMVGHEGPITRIASGCEDEDQARLLALHAQKMKLGDWDASYVHFTPKYSKDHATGKDYKFYNKPRGMLDWLMKGDHGGKDGEGLVPAVAALIDPDQLFLQPLTTKLNNADNLIVTNPVKAEKLSPMISQGHPASQFYGLGDRWLRFNRTYICGKGSPCLDVNGADAWSQYSVGPPYILHFADFKKVASQWVEFVPKVYEEYPQLLAEMYAFCMAAAHHKLPLARIDSYMVSNVGSYGEGWDWIDKMESVCEDGIPFSWHKQLPTFLHACQSYQVGRAKFGKRSVDTSIFECNTPLLHQPGPELMSLASQAEVTEAVMAGGKLSDKMKKLRKMKRDAFMICTASKYVNEAVRRHRKSECPHLE